MTDIILTRTLSTAHYSLLETGINRRWPYEIEIPDPEWVESEETPEQPMIINPISNKKHVENMIAEQYLIPIIKTEMTKEVSAEKQAAIDNIQL